MYDVVNIFCDEYHYFFCQQTARLLTDSVSSQKLFNKKIKKLFTNAAVKIAFWPLFEKCRGENGKT